MVVKGSGEPLQIDAEGMRERVRPESMGKKAISVMLPPPRGKDKNPAGTKSKRELPAKKGKVM